MVAMRWAVRGIGLLSTLVLARLLTPEDFGVVAMALIVVGLFEVMGWAGVDLAVIRQPDAGPAFYDTAWTIQILQGGVLALGLVVAAPLVAGLFGDPRVEAVVRVLAIKPLLDGLENIGVVAFRRELRFATEFRFLVVKKLLSFAAVIGAAVVLRDYRALVIGLLAGAAMGTVLSYLMHPYRPRLSLRERSTIWSFSQWLLVSRIGLFLNRKTDQAVVGSLAGPAVMGSYYMGFELGTFATSEVVMPVRRALFPNLTRLLDRPDALAGAFVAALGAIAALCFPLGAGMAAVADDFVAVVLGPQWTSAVPVIRVLALFGVLAALSATGEILLMAMGHARLSALAAWLELAALVPTLLWAAAHWGAEGAAIARTGVALAFLPFMLYLVASRCLVSVGRQLAALWRPAAAAAAMFAAVTVIDVASFGPAVGLALDVASGAAVYSVVLLGLWHLAGRPSGPEAVIADYARKPGRHWRENRAARRDGASGRRR
jgi:O-antigen/teichoic acid export membrane protein